MVRGDQIAFLVRITALDGFFENKAFEQNPQGGDFLQVDF